MGKTVGASDVSCHLPRVHETPTGVFNVLYKFTFSVLDCHTTKGERLVKWKSFGEFFKE